MSPHLVGERSNQTNPARRKDLWRHMIYVLSSSDETTVELQLCGTRRDVLKSYVKVDVLSRSPAVPGSRIS